MNKRLQELLRQLIGRKEVITSAQLAVLLQVTSRTIRSDIKLLDEILQKSGGYIKSLRGHGYQLEIIDDQKFKSLLESVMLKDVTVPVEPEERVRYLVKRCLLQNDYITMEALADELFISRSTLQNDIKQMKHIIEKYQLQLITKPKYGLKIEGEEQQIRYAISEEVFKRDSTSLLNLTSEASWLLPTEIMETIKSTILLNLRKFNLSLSDMALSNLVIHIAIASKRIKNNYYVSSIKNEEKDITNSKEYQVASSIIKGIEESLLITFPKVEIYYVTMHLLGTKLFLPNDTNTTLDRFNKEIIETVKEVIHKVSNEMQLDIEKDEELFYSIAIHLKPAIYRYQNGMNVRNPILNAIKENHPIAFEAGIIAGKIIEKRHQIEIDENEVGYIAMHIGAAIERNKLKVWPTRCLIVCTTGMGSSKLLFYKLRAKMGEHLTIVGTTELHNLDSYSEQNIDLIISTVPLPDNITIPHVVVSTILDSKDLANISNHLEESGEDIVAKYLEPSRIFLGQELTNPEEVITFLGNKLMEKKIVKDTFVSSVMSREEAASTSYGNLVAIPHPMNPQSDQTFWSVCILKEPIEWGQNKVQVVFLLHVAQNNQEELGPMYQKIIQLVDNKDIIQQLVASKSPTDVITILRKV
ncbi:BglG family transcription antiterminator [Oceanobacillus manasiensis]|uniref:BglG family transcription antiterminator n=1 Tax=Oceanobacillus manasiensis TaxID=586413 RepID=UPI0005A98D98|nr:BglG family transcription antiterminator [Oceanobacillus manasiensis]